jgi:hypothetical protein
MDYATANRLPAAKYKTDDSLYLQRWMGYSGHGTRKAERTEEVAVVVLSIRHGPSWSRGHDGRSQVAPTIYQVRVVETGEEFPAGERELSRDPKVQK